jgi:hypothetical protein
MLARNGGAIGLPLLSLCTVLPGCAAPPLAASAADSTAAAGFRALVAATPGVATYCLAFGSPDFHQDSISSAKKSYDASSAVLALLDGGTSADTVLFRPRSECERRHQAGAAMLWISHLLPLADSSVHVTATAYSPSSRLAYACRVRRVSGSVGWGTAAPCEVTGIID